jgi:hypothetical protein
MYDGKKNKKSGIVVVMLPETQCKGCHIPYDNEKSKIYPEVKNWVNVNSRDEYERRYPYMPERILDNLMKDGVKISVTTWDKIQQADNLRMIIDNAYNNRTTQSYDLSRAMRKRDGSC